MLNICHLVFIISIITSLRYYLMISYHRSNHHFSHFSTQTTHPSQNMECNVCMCLTGFMLGCGSIRIRSIIPLPFTLHPFVCILSCASCVLPVYQTHTSFLNITFHHFDSCLTVPTILHFTCCCYCCLFSATLSFSLLNFSSSFHHHFSGHVFRPHTFTFFTFIFQHLD